MQIQCNSTGREQEENGCYTSTNPLSQNLGTIFFAEISKICKITYNIQLEMTELELQEPEIYFCAFKFHRCENARDSLTLNINPSDFIQFVSDSLAITHP